MLWHGIGRVKAHEHRHKLRKALHLIYAEPFCSYPAPNTTQRNATRPSRTCSGTFATPTPMPIQRGRQGKHNPTRNALHLNYAGPCSLTLPGTKAPQRSGLQPFSRETLRPRSNHRLSRQPVNSSAPRSRRNRNRTCDWNRACRRNGSHGWTCAITFRRSGPPSFARRSNTRRSRTLSHLDPTG